MKEEHPLVPRYYELLNEAHRASEAVDDFDLVSSDPDSRSAFRRLLLENAQAQIHLVNFMRDRWTDLSFQLGLVTGESIRELQEGH